MTVNNRKVCEGLPVPGFSSPTSEGGRPVLAAAGNGNDSNLNNLGSNGNYWSSTPNSDKSNSAWNLNFNSGNFNQNNNRNNGQSVRPVRELVAASADGDRSEWKKLSDDKSLFCSSDGCGLPIGNLSSQLFSNIYLGMLDDFVRRELKVGHYGRYVDDMFIVGESKEYLKSLIEPARTFLRERLKLELSENKTHICDARYGIEFLGVFIKPFRTYVSSRSLRRIRNHLHAVTPRMRAQRAQAVVNSSLGVLSHYDSYCVRKVLVAKSSLPEIGRVSENGLRFYPNALDWRLSNLKGAKQCAS